MKKKFVSLLLVACMLLSILPMGMVSAREAVVSGTCEDGLTWELDMDTNELVISGNGPMKDYQNETTPWHEYSDSITSVLISDGVTSIGKSAFWGMSDLTYVEISGTVQVIKSSAFSECERLCTLILNEGLKTIGWSAFYNTDLHAVYIPASVEVVYDSAFACCKNLQEFIVAEGNPYHFADDNGFLYYREGEDIYLVQCPASLEGVCELPYGVNVIVASAFEGCDKITEIVLPDSLTGIYTAAFARCTALTQLTIPAFVEQIGQNILSDCTAVEKILVAEDNAYFCNDDYGVLFDKDMTKLIQYPAGRGGHYDVPMGTAEIWECAFMGCQKIESVFIPETVERIGYNAFSYAFGLREIKFSEGLKVIEGYNFEMTALKNVVLPASLECIDSNAFSTCISLEDLVVLSTDCVIEDGYATLGERGFTKVYGYTGSTAEAYANANGYSFTSLSHADCENGKHIYGRGVCVLCGALAVDESIVINHTLVLSNNIALNYVIHESYLKDKDDFYMEVKVSDSDDRYNDRYKIQGIKRGEYYYFIMSDITAVQMTDILEAKLVMVKGDQETYSAVDRYSIATYAYNQLGKSYAPEGLKKVCAELLRYGASAQLYKEYRTDALADARLTDEQKAYLTDLSTVSFNDHDLIHEDLAEPVVDWVGVGLDLWSSVTLRYVVDLSRYSGSVEDLTLLVEYETENGEYYAAEITDPVVFVEEKNWYSFDVSFLRLLDMRSVVNVCVYEGDNMLSCTRSYSVDTYCNDMEGTLGTLCSALVSLSDSAVAYFMSAE